MAMKQATMLDAVMLMSSIMREDIAAGKRSVDELIPMKAGQLIALMDDITKRFGYSVEDCADIGKPDGAKDH